VALPRYKPTPSMLRSTQYSLLHKFASLSQHNAVITNAAVNKSVMLSRLVGHTGSSLDLNSTIPLLWRDYISL